VRPHEGDKVGNVHGKHSTNGAFGFGGGRSFYRTSDETSTIGFKDGWFLNLENSLGRTAMSKESRILAGILLITYPTVIFGGVSLLSLLVSTTEYSANPLRQDLWRAGHAHAGVFLVLSLVVLRYVDETALSAGWKWVVRLAAPLAAILLPVAFFVSILDPKAEQPNPVIYLAYVGAFVLAIGLFVLGVSLVRGSKDQM
jgi:hypothetical protein